MINPRDIKIQDYNYPLPDERIAKFPVAKRDESKLLVYNKGVVSHDVFRNITSYLPSDSLLVYNNTRVIQARLRFHKTTGALIEVFLLEPVMPRDYEQIFQTRSECSWICMIGNLKKWKEGSLSRMITVGNQSVQLTVERQEEEATGHRCHFTWEAEDESNSVSFAEILEAMGELPIPPYLNRATEETDKQTYQTVYSKIKGSVAAPTAGLHFTEEVLKDVDNHGIEREEVTLHVGAGTFKPVKSVRIDGHTMHREYISVKRSTIERLIAHGGKAIAVGTTSVRTLESLYYIGCRLHRNPNLNEYGLTVEQWEPYDIPGELSSVEALTCILEWFDRNNLTTLHTSTRIIIAPGYNYHIVKMLITNFHQPQSTLLLLVSALIGDDWHKVYDYALNNDFRFLSYGDSSLLIP
ncbi:MAG: S-adenosylmethionine:tRNA ribosyltransferase-isomerase [Prevotella sp.]|nr:S-adenosylmethionine:tRNA ribosyltransferase-isomerase [Candidatus Prevotella equi]